MRLEALMKVGKINIYDYIGSDGITASDISSLLNSFESQSVDLIEVHINSPGGEIFEAFAIFNLLKESGKCVTFVEGIAASSASIIALSGNQVKIYKSAYIMIHNPWNISFGDTNTHQKNADDLAKFRDTLIDIYKSKTGMAEDELKNMLNKQTFLNADESLQHGFADEVINNLSAKNYVALYSEVVNNKSKIKGNPMLNKILSMLGFSDHQIKEGLSESEIEQKIVSLNESRNDELNTKITSLSDTILNLADSVVSIKERVDKFEKNKKDILPASDFLDTSELNKSIDRKVELGSLPPSVKNGVDQLVSFVKGNNYSNLNPDEYNLQFHSCITTLIDSIDTLGLFKKIEEPENTEDKENDTYQGFNVDKTQLKLCSEVKSYAKTNNISFEEALKIVTKNKL